LPVLGDSRACRIAATGTEIVFWPSQLRDGTSIVIVGPAMTVRASAVVYLSPLIWGFSLEYGRRVRAG
jgi:hypothetical protein